MEEFLCWVELILSNMSSRSKKIMVQPINLIFRFLQNRTLIEIWLYDNTDIRIQGCIIGFDEYMNLVLDDAVEVHQKRDSRQKLGRILLKGDTITMMTTATR
ncbi:Small nuclear ribonucleoprotein E [Gracilariopsis chorda]|uniref:Small nuclear ribonucleoprotein E n=1 Tax=Gracilariopsis chorda TaxID=448386 RepID=A0A2V3J739_9FLOR|nr:Small nuclear ribonucleoprotein E [Gracilariopsis chorda]|eukprot:PXF50174.1 Small nuclear ribonucleoprotein E [Gracilariopsis chorda]